MDAEDIGCRGDFAAMQEKPDRPAGARMQVVYNPTAGRRRLRLLEDVLARLRVRGVDIVLHPTGARGDAERLAAAIDPDDLAVAAGGDGTINEVVNGLMRRREDGRAPPALGLVPLGTANVLAREIGLPVDAASIVAALAGGRSIEFRPGRLRFAAGTRHFAMMAGVGFDADVVARVDLGIKRLLGKGAYALASGGRLLAYRPHLLRLNIDGAPYQAASVVITRGRHYAGPYVCAPGAALERPELHACLFEQPGRLAVMRYGAALLADRLARARRYRVVRGREIDVLGVQSQLVQADGDIVASLPLTADVAEQAIGLKVP